MAINGNNLIIALDGTAVAGARTATITNGCEAIEIASASDGQWTKLIAGRKSWSVNIGWLVPAINNVADEVLASGTMYTLTVKDREGNTLLQGQALCTQSESQFNRGSLAHGTWTLKGSGPLARPSS